MSEYNNDFSEFLNNTTSMQPLLELFESVMALPDESLSNETVANISAAAKGAITPALKKESVAAMVRGFEEQELTRGRAEYAVEMTKNEFNDYIEALKPSVLKRAIIGSVLNELYDVFDMALDRYHNYNIDLLISLEEGAIAPTYAHDTDACADLYAMETITLPAHSLSNMVKTGVHIALPEGWMAFIFPRSSMGLKTGLRLSNSAGIIDADYRGQLGVVYDNISDSDYTIKAGDRIAQLMIAPSYRFKARITQELPETERGEGGFGSTGV